VTIENIAAGSHLFSLYSEDANGNRSSLLTFPVSVTSSASTNVDGIFISPTLDVDKSQVKKGDPIYIFGQTSPNSDITITVNSHTEQYAVAKADNFGAYSYGFNTTPLEYGQHVAKSAAAISGEISQNSKSVSFAVGDTNILKSAASSPTASRSDTNGDGKVNLVDFSIAAYWYRKSSPPANVDVNGDGKVDLVDFSILAFNWTG
jgi:hypothetical protein